MRQQPMISLILCVACLWAWTAEAQTQLVGQDAGDHVKLLWFAQEWSADLDGFELRQRAGEGDWQPLHGHVLRPSIEHGRDLSAVDSSGTASRQAREGLDRLIEGGEVVQASADEMISRFRQDPRGLGLWNLRLIGEFDLALATGFGFVDRAPEATAEYGLFPVVGGTTASEPAAIYRRGSRGSVADIVLEAEVRRVARDALAVSWTFDAARMEQLGVAGFQVFRQEGGQDGEQAVQIGPGRFIFAGGGSTAAVVDKQRDPGQEAVYSIKIS